MNSIFRICASSIGFATVSGLRIPSCSDASFVQMSGLSQELLGALTPEQLRHFADMLKSASDLVGDIPDIPTFQKQIQDLLAAPSPGRDIRFMGVQELEHKNANHGHCVVRIFISDFSNNYFKNFKFKFLINEISNFAMMNKF